MALDAPPLRSVARQTGLPGAARRHAGLAVCGGVVALVLAVGIHQARRPLPPQAASVLATEPITPTTPAVAVAPAPTVAAAVAAVPVTVAPAPATVVTTVAPVAVVPEPAVAVTTATAPEPVFSLGQLCWPLGASARTVTGTPIMCTRLDPAGIAYPDGHARWRRT